MNTPPPALRRNRQQTQLMRRFSKLAGPIGNLPKQTDYQVTYATVERNDPWFYRCWMRLLAYGALTLAVVFGGVLFQPANWVVTQRPAAGTNTINWLMLGCLALLQVFVIVGTLAATRATLKARDPQPVRPPRHLRVAFVTTRAPGEPIAMVHATLQAMRRVQYIGGQVEVWLLDETKDASLKRLCRSLNVRYFSRTGVTEWNTVQPSHPIARRNLARLVFALSFGRLRTAHLHLPDAHYAARSKHGNFNAWRAHLVKRDLHYDILAGVDTDHVPEANYLERLLGYFRDPNVAYVVGPQVYGNYRSGLAGLVARWSESQASFFQSTIQRAANASGCAMFVGTNYAVRTSALDQVGGFQPCITEDMATGLAIHSSRNPVTGQAWKSVYTPDVLAIGEGPDLWGPYFSQQWRWAAGTFDTWRHMVWRRFFRLPWRAQAHYLLILCYYPMTALTWLLAVASSLAYLLSGATAILAPWGEFVSLYLMTLVMQLSLYFWNRRYNVSPHEPAGTYGVPGMVISSLTAPVYLAALIGVVLGRRSRFVVTRKGIVASQTDHPAAFRCHLQWALIIGLGLGYGVSQHREHPAMLAWTGVLLIICLLPFSLGAARAFQAYFAHKRTTRTNAAQTTNQPTAQGASHA